MATENVNLIATSGGLLNDINSTLAKQTLMVLQNKTKFYQCGEKLGSLDGNGKIWKAIRYLKVTLPVAALSESTTPDGSSLTTETVTGTAEQWGMYISLSDVGLMTLAHPVLQKTNDLLGAAAAEIVDREIQVALESATNIFYGLGTSRITCTGTGGVLSTSTVGRMVADLRNAGAEPHDGEYYIGILDPSVENDIILESKFLVAAQYQQIKALYKGEIGTWMGVRWLRSNFVRTYYGNGLTGATGATGTWDSGNIVSGVAYSSCMVGYDPTYRLKMAISDWHSGGATDTGYSLTYTTPATPANYLWDLYVASGSAATPTRCDGQSVTGRTGNTAIQVVDVGSGAAAPLPPVTGATLHNVWIFGKEAFGVTEVASLQRTLTPDVASDSDPLKQRRKAGIKLFFKPIILEDDFMAKAEVESDAE